MLEEKILNDYKEAMKARDTLKSSVLSFLRADMLNTAVAKKKNSLDDTEVIAVIKKQIKQRQDSIEQFTKGNRLDMAEKEKKEFGILKAYLPQELSEEAVKKIIDEVISLTGATSIKDMGKVMKEANLKIAGQADGRLVSELVRQKLSLICVLLLSAIFLAGCTTYKFAQGQGTYSAGYVALRDSRVIPEYTVGKDNTVPADINLAKERFKRRRSKVEYYYKKMGDMQSRLMECLEYPAAIFKAAIGELWMPVRAVADYRYNHNVKYRDRVDRKDAQEDALERSKIDKVKDKLKLYVENDLALEQDKPGVGSAVVEEALVAAEKLQEASLVKPVIIVKPSKGVSPLTVHFSGAKSRSQAGKIISYSWDFGDGDTSTKANPINTFYSTSFSPKSFTVSLTVYDTKGNNASASAVVEVTNK